MTREELVALTTLKQRVRELTVEVQVLEGRVDLYARNIVRLKRKLEKARDEASAFEQSAREADRLQRDNERLTKNYNVQANNFRIERENATKTNNDIVSKLVEEHSKALTNQAEQYERLANVNASSAPQLTVALKQVLDLAESQIPKVVVGLMDRGDALTPGVAAMRSIANRARTALAGGPFAKEEAHNAKA